MRNSVLASVVHMYGMVSCTEAQLHGSYTTSILKYCPLTAQLINQSPCSFNVLPPPTLGAANHHHPNGVSSLAFLDRLRHDMCFCTLVLRLKPSFDRTSLLLSLVLSHFHLAKIGESVRSIVRSNGSL